MSDLLPFEPLPILHRLRLLGLIQNAAEMPDPHTMMVLAHGSEDEMRVLHIEVREIASMARELLSMRAIVQRLSDEAAYAEQQPSEG
jgi:hypothetical protein